MERLTTQLFNNSFQNINELINSIKFIDDDLINVAFVSNTRVSDYFITTIIRNGKAREYYEEIANWCLNTNKPIILRTLLRKIPNDNHDLINNLFNDVLDYGYVKLAEIMLKSKKINRHLNNQHLITAVSYGYYRLVDLMLNNGLDISQDAINQAINNDDVDTIKTLLNSSDVNMLELNL